METVIAIIIIVFGVLQIILFFKIWGMTNDIRIMRDHLLNMTIKGDSVSPDTESDDDLYFKSNAKFKLNQTVTYKHSGKRMIVKGMTSTGQYKCYVDGFFVNNFDEDELIS